MDYLLLKEIARKSEEIRISIARRQQEEEEEEREEEERQRQRRLRAAQQNQPVAEAPAIPPPNAFTAVAPANPLRNLPPLPLRSANATTTSSSAVAAPAVPEYAGGDSLWKRSPGSSVSFSQSPAVASAAASSSKQPKDDRKRSSKSSKKKKKKKNPLKPRDLAQEQRFARYGICLSDYDDDFDYGSFDEAEEPAAVAAQAKEDAPPNKAVSVPHHVEAPVVETAVLQEEEPPPSPVLKRPEDYTIEELKVYVQKLKEKKRREAEEQARRVAAQEEAQRVAAEEEARHVAAEEEARRVAAEEEARQAAAALPEEIHPTETAHQVQAAAAAVQEPPQQQAATSTSSAFTIGMSQRVQKALEEAQSPPPTPVHNRKRSYEYASSSSSSSSSSSFFGDKKQPPLSKRVLYDDSPVRAAAIATPAIAAPLAPPTSAFKPRNPITLAREEQESIQFNSSRLTKQDEDDLWDDSKWEAQEKSPDDAKPKSKKRGRKSSKSSSMDSSPSPTKCAPTSRASLSSVPSPSIALDATMTTTAATSLERKPEFDNPLYYTADEQPLALRDNLQVPASINRYLADHQREGIEFMCTAMMDYGGAILGHDMGLGKTVQVVALMAALLEKKGTSEDQMLLDRRKKAGRNNLQLVETEKEYARRRGIMPLQDYSQLDFEPMYLPDWAPILLIVPPNLVDHWKKDISTWGHFSFAAYQSGGTKLPPLIESIRLGLNEILICPQSMFQQEKSIFELQKVHWKLIVVDELHIAKNAQTKLSDNLRKLKGSQKVHPGGCKVIGLTGTAMQNNHQELYNIVDLAVEGHLDSWGDFKRRYADPIKFGRNRDADEETKKRAEDAKMEFNETKLSKIYLRRTKEETLKNDLPQKNERIVFCRLTAIQKAMYQHILEQPDFEHLKSTSKSCDCGVNSAIYRKALQLRTDNERLAFLRRHKSEIKKMGECCYEAPFADGRGSVENGDEIHPDAVLWKRHHPTGKLCERCPYCCLFPALVVLSKVCSHACLIQVDPHNRTGKSDAEMEHAKAMAEVFIPDEIKSQMPGGGIYRNVTSEYDDFALSGKMSMLHRLLSKINKQGGRTLVFSESTQTLDLIEVYVKMHYKYLRMDGTTPKNQRTAIANEFSRDESVKVLLLSKKAFGTGINLTAANNVILYDIDWNPAQDAQAQDRAHRLGQTKDVVVFRLVARGTIEELRYLRQVYKNQLKDETIIEGENPDRPTAKRQFRGVADDQSRRGELFGLANLLKFKDGFFIDYGKTSRETVQKYGEDVYRPEDLVPDEKALEEAAKLVDEEETDEFMAIADIAKLRVKEGRADADAEEDSDDEYNYKVLGGESQLNMDALNEWEHSSSAEVLSVSDSPHPDTKPPAVSNFGLAPSNNSAFVQLRGPNEIMPALASMFGASGMPSMNMMATANQFSGTAAPTNHQTFRPIPSPVRSVGNSQEASVESSPGTDLSQPQTQPPPALAASEKIASQVPVLPVRVPKPLTTTTTAASASASAPSLATRPRQPRRSPASLRRPVVVGAIQMGPPAAALRSFSFSNCTFTPKKKKLTDYVFCGVNPTLKASAKSKTSPPAALAAATSTENWKNDSDGDDDSDSDSLS